jgi:hypothetical protein
VIENWNSANDFILYGKGGEFATNRLENQEILMPSLHLLHVTLVYVNTLMIQQVLAEPEWRGRFTPVDRRALLPLEWQHVNPYGLNMHERIPLEKSAAAATLPISAFARLSRLVRARSKMIESFRRAGAK